MHHGVSKMALYIELEENVKVNFNPPQFLHCTRGVNSIRTREWLPIFASETHDFIVDEDIYISPCGMHWTSGKVEATSEGRRRIFSSFFEFAIFVLLILPRTE